MRKEEIRDILPSILAGGTDQGGRLVEWCRQYLPEVLQTAGIHKWQPPYCARVSGASEQHNHSWKDGTFSTLTRRFMDVIETATGTVLGKVPISNWKSLHPICECIQRNDKWYFLAANEGIELYSLPDLTLVASMKFNGKITDMWCPRTHTTLHEWINGDSENCAAYLSHLDDEVQDGEDWESALFAFVEFYDPLCSGPDYVCMLDLRDFSDGILKKHPVFGFEKPNHIPLRVAVNVSSWSKEWPSVDVATYESLSIVDGHGPSDMGWRDDQLDYFKWSGEKEDSRTSNQRHHREAVAWGNSDDCQYLSAKLGAAYTLGFFEHVGSREHALELAVSNPEYLKKIVLHCYRIGAISSTCWAIAGLAALTPSSEIRDVLRYIAKHARRKEFRQAAKDALCTAYPEDGLVQRFVRWISRST